MTGVDLTIIQKMIEQGADVNMRDANQTNLHFFGISPEQFQMLQDFNGLLHRFEERQPEDWYRLLEGFKEFPGSMFQNSAPALKFKRFIDSLPEPDFTQTDALSALTDKQGDYAPIDNPRFWQKFDQVVKELNGNGMQLNGDALLNEDGTPNALFERAIKLGKVKAIFTHENWEGANQEELRDALQCLPEDLRKTIPNRHTLLATVGREERHQDQGASR